tara:strand:- start:9826 stop:11985 length:2160 start_codon:yes stop_codon:yes gene_type:complete
MKVFHIINSLAAGGSETSLYSIIKKNERNFHIIIIFSEKGIFYKKFSYLKNCKIIDISNFSFFKKISFIYNFIKENKKYSKQVVLNSWMYKSHIICAIVKIFISFSLLFHIRHCGITNKHKFINKFPIYLTLYFSKFFANKIIYNSYSSKLNHEKIGFERKKAIVIHNGFSNLRNKKKYKKMFNNKIVIGMLARKNFIKDHLTLIKSFKILSKSKKNIVLFLQGSGLKKDKKINNFISKNKIENIYFSNSNDKEFFFSQIDIHVLSSFGESFPNVVVESIQREKITLSSNVGDVNKFLIKKNIFQIGNVSECKSKIENYLKLIEKKSFKIKKIKDELKEKIKKDFDINKKIKLLEKVWIDFQNLKKILIVIPSLGGGGAEKVVTFLSKDLIEKGYNTSILVLGSKKSIKNQVDKNVQLIFLNKSRSLFAIFDLIKYFYKDYDLIVSTIIQCNILCIIVRFLTFSRQKLYLRETNTPSEILKYDKSIQNFLLFYLRNLYSFADYILCNSKGVIKDLNKNLNINKKKLFYLPNSFDQQIIKKLSNQKTFIKKKPYFIYAGSISKQKNVNLIVESFNLFLKKNKKIFYLYIFGEGDKKIELNKLITDLNLKNRIIVRNYQKNIFKYLKKSSGVLLSSNWEGMPNILLHALVVNKPILSTDCKSGPRELKNFGYDIKLVPKNNIVQFSKGLELIISKKHLVMKNVILNKNYSDNYKNNFNKIF